MTLNEILTAAVKKQASDVHLKAGLVPVIRKHGRLRPLQTDLPPLSNQDLEQMATQLMDAEQLKIFQIKKEVDVGYGVSGVGRFRVNIFRQRGSIRMVVRAIPHKVPSLQDLNLPEVMARIADQERGLVLVTGVTGSGKSSTLAAMIDHINTNQNTHIITVEDPIEFLIRDRKSIISQRELGVDTSSFSGALRSALRQDPDVILIGEMRDRETIEIAMTAAETGHLVFSTLHTLDAMESINRILSAFEPHQHQQIRLQLASVLKAIISQRLARRKDGKGFVPVIEILINNARTKEMIEDQSRTKDLIKAIEESNETFSMQSFDQHLMKLVRDQSIAYEEALKLSTHPENFALKYSGVSSGGKAWDGNGEGTNTNAAEWGPGGGIRVFELDDDLDNDDEGSGSGSGQGSGHGSGHGSGQAG